MMDSGCSNTTVSYGQWADHVRKAVGEMGEKQRRMNLAETDEKPKTPMREIKEDQKEDDGQCVTVKSNKSRGTIKQGTHTHSAAHPRETPRDTTMRDLDAIEDIVNREARMMVDNIMGRIRQLEGQQNRAEEQGQQQEGGDEVESCQEWDDYERNRLIRIHGEDWMNQTFQDRQEQSQQSGRVEIDTGADGTFQRSFHGNGGELMGEEPASPSNNLDAGRLDHNAHGVNQGQSQQLERVEINHNIATERLDRCTHDHDGLRGKEDLKKTGCPLCSERK